MESGESSLGDKRARAQALVLTLLMVTSVFAGTVVFGAGTASAAPDENRVRGEMALERPGTATGGTPARTATARSIHSPAVQRLINGPGVQQDVEPPGFQKEKLVDGGQPMGLQFLGTDDDYNRFLLLQKNGQILIVNATTGNSQPYMDLSNSDNGVDSGGESGLISITLDPNFEQNGYFYLFYTPGSPDTIRIARFKHSENQGGLTSTGNASSEMVVWEDGQVSNGHVGGGLDFGPDGALWLTVGEQHTGGQDPGDTQGNVIRVNPDGSIPTTNPYYQDGDPNTLPEVFALGNRNPFSAGWELQTAHPRLYIAQVGGNQGEDWEEIDTITPQDIQNASQNGTVLNFGWDKCEDVYDNNNFPTKCTDAHSFPGSTFVAPFWSYVHNSSDVYTDGSIMAGTIYDGTMFPAEYQGAYFFSDQARDWVKYMTFHTNGSIDEVKTFDDEMLGGPIDTDVGPNGALYVTKIAKEQSRFPYVGVSKITYQNPDTLPPEVSASTTSINVENGTTETVEITANDPSNQSVALSASGLPSFAAFTDDGDNTGTLTLSPGASDEGTYQATITGTDPDGNQDQVTIDINVFEAGESTPEDWDGDGTANANDADDDNDGTPDTDDPFPVDPNDGTTTTLPVELSLEPNSEPGTLLGVGFTGLMNNGDGYEALYDPEKVTVGSLHYQVATGAYPNNVPSNMRNGFQFGVNTPDEPFYINTTVSGLPASPQQVQIMGMQIGDGSQNDWMKLVIGASQPKVEFSNEFDGDVNIDSDPKTVPGVAGPGDPKTNLSLVVYPDQGTHGVVEAYYKTEGGDWTFYDSKNIPSAEWLDESDGQGLAVGIEAEAVGAPSFNGTWHHFTVDTVADGGDDTTGNATIAQALAGEDNVLGPGDLQDAVFYWKSGDPVPGTGGKTIDSVQTLQDLVFFWKTGKQFDDVNAAPTAQITNPSDGDTFQEGETLTFNGSGSDPEDGQLGGNSLEWYFAVQHSTHNHQIGTTQQGTNGTFVPEVPSDHEASEIGYLVRLTAEDSQGDTDVAEVELDPETSNITVQSSPSGIQVEFGPPLAPVGPTPYSKEVVVGNEKDLGAPATACADGTEYTFDGWADGTSTAERTVTAQAADTSYTAQYSSTGNSCAVHSARIAITEGFQNKDTSPWLFEDSVNITNTGTVPITSVTMDASTAALPDLQAQGMKDGYSGSASGQTLTIDFSGDPIQPGETAQGNIDFNHDTSNGVGTSTPCPCHQAYEISGLEMLRTNMTVEYDDGVTQTTQPYTDGSPGGGVAVADGDVPSPLNIYKVENDAGTVNTDSTALDSPHEAATVQTAEQKIHIDGGPPGGTVHVLRLEGQMNITGTAGDTIGNVDQYIEAPYEANRFYVNKSEQTVQLDGNGHKDVFVTLTNNTDASNQDYAGVNYIVAVSEDSDGDTGLLSNVVVLKYAPEQDDVQNDFDGDGTPNAQDADDDGDGTPDTDDPFALDPDDGTSTNLPVNLNLEPNSEPGTILDVGFTGLMNNGQDWMDLYDPEKVTIGSLHYEVATGAYPNNNPSNMRNGFQFGVNTPDQPFAINTTVSGLPASPQQVQVMGMQIGNGSQNDWMKLVIGSQDPPDVEFSHEFDGDVNIDSDQPTVSGLAGPDDPKTNLSLVVYPNQGTHGVVEAYYRTEGGDWTFTGSKNIPSAEWLDESDGQGLAVGIEAEAVGAPSFNGTWHQFTVEKLPSESVNSSSSVKVTPNSDDTEVSTFSSDAFQVENTGESNISSVSIDLSTAAMPDMVFDPNGTAGDSAAGPLSIDTQTGDGVGVVSTADGDVFSQPHNGVNGSDGFDVLTINFTDFEPGETVTFSPDNDPTSIKGATVSSQEAGPVSGLELARGTVTVDYGTGETQESQLFGDGSLGGSNVTLDGDEEAAPQIVGNPNAQSPVLGTSFHSGSEVTDPSQTIEIQHPGQGSQVATLVRIEGELELKNVPDYDGTPGYEIEDFEANKIETVEYKTVTLDSTSPTTVPVTLTNSTDSGGYNYFFAAVKDPATGDYGDVSNVEVMKLVEGQSGPSMNDFDGDGTLNANDPDDDNDGAPDTLDPFAIDPDNGTSTEMPVHLDFEANSYPNTILGVGFTGLMINGTDPQATPTDYQDLYDPSQVTIANSALTYENVENTVPDYTPSNFKFGFHVGVNTTDEPFRMNTTVSGIPENPDGQQVVGLTLSTGDQQNWVKLIGNANPSPGRLEFGHEYDGNAFVDSDKSDVPGLTGPDDPKTNLSIVAFPSNNTLKAYYQTEGNNWTFYKNKTVPAGWLDTTDDSGLAVGLMAYSSSGDPFNATWHHLTIEELDTSSNSNGGT